VTTAFPEKTERLFFMEMKKELRSGSTFKGRLMAGARSLWRANGMQESHFGKPVIAVVNSYTGMVPGHRHLQEAGRIVKQEIERLGYFAPEFNTIAIDDGIAMGHQGMLYSLPSRELIADSIEYMINAHRVDAMICISNCDKVTPGMLMAAMRLNIPALFVSGGPMEAGIVRGAKQDLINVMVAAGNKNTSDEDLDALERNACPGCGSCAGMFTANSMNCLTEAIGLSLPGNGTLVASHTLRKKLFADAARTITEIAEEYYNKGNEDVLPRNVASREAFLNAMTVDIAMGGSTNTVLHLLAVANEAEVDFTLNDIDALSRKVPNICKVSPSSEYRMEDVHRAGGVMALMGELRKASLINAGVRRADGLMVGEAIDRYDILSPGLSDEGRRLFLAAPGGPGRSFDFGCQDNMSDSYDTDRTHGCIRDVIHAYSTDGGLAVLFGNIAVNGAVVKSAGVKSSQLTFRGPARVFESQEEACDAILGGGVNAGDVVVIRYEGPAGGPGMQEMLYPTSFLKSAGLDGKCALITDGRFSGGTSGLSVGHISPEAAAGGALAILEDGDNILIDIPARILSADIPADVMQERIDGKRGAFAPVSRDRIISLALKLYSGSVSSADMGAVRMIKQN